MGIFLGTQNHCVVARRSMELAPAWNHIMNNQEKLTMEMRNLGYLGLLGLLGFLGSLLDNPHLYGLYGLYGFFGFFGLPKKQTPK